MAYITNENERIMMNTIERQTAEIARLAAEVESLKMVNSTLNLETSEAMRQENADLRKEVESLRKKEQVLYDLHEALGVKWGEDPYQPIRELRSRLERAEATIESEMQENERLRERIRELEEDFSVVKRESNKLYETIAALEKAGDAMRTNLYLLGEEGAKRWGQEAIDAQTKYIDAWDKAKGGEHDSVPS